MTELRSWKENTKTVRSRLLLVLIAAAAFLPFIHRPVWFDDHAIFRQVLDVAEGKNAALFGQVPHEAGWIPGSNPTEANPPVFAFLVGSVARLAGTEFWKSHLFLLLVQIGGLLAFHEIARRRLKDPLWASLLLLFSPACFLTAYAMLVDGLLIPAITAAVWAWMKGEETERPGWFFLSASLAGAAALVKYTGVIAVALIALRIALGPRNAALRRLPWLAVPAALFAAWLLTTQSIYGQSHFGAVASASLLAPEAARAFVLAAFAGATLPAVPAMIVVVLARGSRREWALHAAVLAGGAVVGWTLLPIGRGALLGVAAGALLSWALKGFRPPWADRENLFLCAWAAAALAGLSVARGWVCARYLVVAAPAVVLLTARHVEGANLGPALRGGILAASAVLTLALAQADTRRAFVEKAAGDELNRWAQARPGLHAYFPAATPTGLGFYLDPALWKPIQAGARLSDGDVVVIPVQTLPLRFAPTHPRLAAEAEFAYASKNPLRLMDRRSLAGFYGSIWGPMPFSFSRETLERFVVLRAHPEAAQP